MGTRSEGDTNEVGGVTKYLLALTPFFSRLAVIALITLSHSASWLAPQTGTRLATNKPIETARNEETGTIPAQSAQSLPAPHTHPSAFATPQRSETRIPSSDSRAESSYGGFLRSHSAPRFHTQPYPPYRYPLGSP